MPRRLRHGLDAGGRDPLRCPATATVSTQAAEIRRVAPPPSPRSRRRRSRSATVPRRLRHGLDAGGQDPPRCPTAFSTVSTPAAEICRGAPPPSPRSRRRWPRSAAAAPPSPRQRSAAVPRRLLHGLDAGGQLSPQCPASLAALSTRRRPRSAAVPRTPSTMSAEIRRGAPPPLPCSRRRRPRFDPLDRLTRRVLDACYRDPPWSCNYIILATWVTVRKNGALDN